MTWPDRFEVSVSDGRNYPLPFDVLDPTPTSTDPAVDARIAAAKATSSSEPTQQEDHVVNIDEGENWTITFRTNKLKQMGWNGTFPEWRQAMKLLNANPLDLEPPAKSLDEAKQRAKEK